MPAVLSYALFAERVLAVLREKEPCLALREDGYYWGAQSPDIFFYHRFLPRQKGESLAKYGALLHDVPLDKMLRELKGLLAKQAEDSAAWSYGIGLLIHLALDSASLPFIRYGSKQLYEQGFSSEDSCRHEIESALDIVLLRYEKAKLPADISLKKLVSDDKSLQPEMAAFCRKLLYALLGEEVSEQSLKQVLADFRSALGFMTDRFLVKRHILQRRERRKNQKPELSCYLRGISEGDDCDYANILHGEWSWPPQSEKVRTESFLELYEGAVDFAAELILGFLSGRKAEKPVKNDSL